MIFLQISKTSTLNLCVLPIDSQGSFIEAHLTDKPSKSVQVVSRIRFKVIIHFIVRAAWLGEVSLSCSGL